jgi:hypothetical protein
MFFDRRLLMVKRKTAGEEIQALKARIAELEKAAEDEAKVFVASIREALRAAKIEAPGECSLTVSFAEAGTDFTVSYRATGTRAPRHSNGERDPRLPAPGTKIVKTHKDRDHEVVFTDDNSVEMDGKRYGTVSAAAKALTGTAVNGFAFFGLK